MGESFELVRYSEVLLVNAGDGWRGNKLGNRGCNDSIVLKVVSLFYG